MLFCLLERIMTQSSDMRLKIGKRVTSPVKLCHNGSKDCLATRIFFERTQLEAARQNWFGADSAFLVETPPKPRWEVEQDGLHQENEGHLPVFPNIYKLEQLHWNARAVERGVSQVLFLPIDNIANIVFLDRSEECLLQTTSSRCFEPSKNCWRNQPGYPLKWREFESIFAKSRSRRCI